MKLVGGIDFNRDDDKKEFGVADKVVRVNRFEDDGRHCVSFNFELGRRDDDTFSLVFGWSELLTAIAACDEDQL